MSLPQAKRCGQPSWKNISLRTCRAANSFRQCTAVYLLMFFSALVIVCTLVTCERKHFRFITVDKDEEGHSQAWIVASLQVKYKDVCPDLCAGGDSGETQVICNKHTQCLCYIMAIQLYSTLNIHLQNLVIFSCDFHPYSLHLLLWSVWKKNKTISSFYILLKIFFFPVGNGILCYLKRSITEPL